MLIVLGVMLWAMFTGHPVVALALLIVFGVNLSKVLIR